MRYYIDTEFAESPGQLDLISIGIVAEDGREFYAVAADGWDPQRCHPWVREHVLPNLGAASRLSRTEIRDAILAFVGEDIPEFWGYYADYDWVVFCWIFGAMIDLPSGWPKYCRDLKQAADHAGVRLPHSNDEHNALGDALDIARNYDWLCSVDLEEQSDG